MTEYCLHILNESPLDPLLMLNSLPVPPTFAGAEVKSNAFPQPDGLFAAVHADPAMAQIGVLAPAEFLMSLDTIYW